MSRRTITVEQGVFTVAFDDPPPSAERWRALAVGQARDEITGLPALPPIDGATNRPAVSVVANRDGAFCFRARPWRAFPPLLAPSYTLAAFVEGSSYLGTRLDVTVPTNQRQVIAPAPVAGSGSVHLNIVAGLRPGQLLLVGPSPTAEHARIRHLGPAAQEVTLEGTFYHPHGIGDPVVADGWTPIDLGVVELRREPVVIRGRAVRRDAAALTVTPIAGAVITLLDFWWRLADVRAQLPGKMTDPVPANRAFLLPVSPGTAAARPLGGAVAGQVLTAVAADDRLLLDASPAPSDRRLVVAPPIRHEFRISSRQAIGPGALLRVDPDRGDIAETIEVLGITGFGAPNQSGVVTASLPFRVSHRAGAPIVRLTPGAPGPAAALRRASQPGDRTLFVSDLTILPVTGDVRISGGTAPDEFQRVRRFEATSDAEGYFELPAVHRVAALQLRATAAALTPVQFTLHPEYGQYEQWIDVAFA